MFDGSTASVGSYNLNGGDGNDTITVGDASSNARVEGGLGNDKIYVGNESRAWILPGEGQDEIYGSWDDDATTNTKSEDYHHNLSYEDIETSGVSIDIGPEGTGTTSAIIKWNGYLSTNDTFELISGLRAPRM